MPLILNIETAADFCSLCISEGNNVLVVKETNVKNAHAEQITLLIEACLSTIGKTLNEIDAIALSSGPGSYTGLRVGSSTAKGICYALNKPLIAVDTLRALASATHHAVQADAIYVPMIDARRMEVYTCLYDSQNQPMGTMKAQVIDAHSFAEYFKSGQQLVFSGNGAPKCQEYLQSPLATFHPLLCHAANMVPLSHHAFLKNDFQDIAYFSPNYLKAPNITRSKKNIL